MPRAGRHPLKTKDFKDKPRVHQSITVTTIVYIPMLSGYWEESLDVLKLFFESLYANTNKPFDMMVFDNGSCEDVQNYLLELKHIGRIQYLVFSQQNLRKLGALNFLLSSAPGECVAYADSDVYFLPGWLDESLKVLESFPEAGKVTAVPMVGGDATENFDVILAAAKEDATISMETGILVPEIYVNTHRISLGVTNETYAQRTKNRKDVLFKRHGCAAYLSGADFQFTITRKAIEAALPLQLDFIEEYFDPIYSPVLERRLHQAGFWQLSTAGYWIHHMGNHVPDFGAELDWMDPHWLQQHTSRSALQSPVRGKKTKFIDRILQNRTIRRFLTRVHLLSYRWLYE